jgi:fatty acid desaturase
MDAPADARRDPLRLSTIAWDEIPRHPLPPEAVRVLRYMQDIESHTIAYLRPLLATRAIDDPEMATFLACWLYEETFHGKALDRFLAGTGHTAVVRARSRATLSEWLDGAATRILGRCWPDFVAVHMTWGAINELTTLMGYARLSAVAGHPVLSELLSRIMRDESRHFHFYFRQAARRLVRPRTARLTRLIIERFWAPVGWGVAPAEETRFLARYLLTGPGGEAVARKIDATVRRLPGLKSVRLLRSWMAREVAVA